MHIPDTSLPPFSPRRSSCVRIAALAWWCASGALTMRPTTCSCTRCAAAAAAEIREVACGCWARGLCGRGEGEEAPQASCSPFACPSPLFPLRGCRRCGGSGAWRSSCWQWPPARASFPGSASSLPRSSGSRRASRKSALGPPRWAATAERGREQSRGGGRRRKEEKKLVLRVAWQQNERKNVMVCVVS
jgi:hypothetical protein